MRSRHLFPAGLAVCTALLLGHEAKATIYVDGGADTLVIPALAAEFQIVYAGQNFTAAQVSSLPAETGFLTNDCTFGGVLADCSWSPLGAATTIDFGVSVIPLTRAQISAYNAGLGATDGPIIQFPLYGVGVGIVTREQGITANGQVVLDDGALCGIFSGQLTDWSQFSYNAPGGSFSVVYDSDAGSGTTWLLTQHLNAVCNGTNSAFTTLPVPVTSNFASLPVPGGVANNPRFIPAQGSTGMQAAMLETPSVLGYIGPSYTDIAPSSPATSSLVVASLFNAQDRSIQLPTASAIGNGMRSPGPGAANTGVPTTQAQVSNPVAWVETNPQPAHGYPIVGYASWLFSSCYSSVGSIIQQYLTAPYNPTGHKAAIANAGLVPTSTVNGKLYLAIVATFLSKKSTYHLDIQDPSTCLAYQGR